MNKTLIIAACLLTTLLAGCGKAKEKINSAGEKVGEGTSEFFQGVAEGVDKTRECKLEMSDALKASGLSYGKYMVQTVAEGGTSNNRVTIYLMFEKDFRGPVNLKVFDPNGLEYGRLRQDIAGNAGEAMFFDFIFDVNTDIEARSRIVME